jgi:hypothetical protein
MKSKRHFLTFFAVIVAQNLLFCQKSNRLYLNWAGVTNEMTLNYEREVFKFRDSTFSINGHLGIGGYKFDEVIATKFIKGEFFNPNTQSLLTNILLSVAFSTKDRTETRQQFFAVNNYYAGGRFCLNAAPLSLSLGLDVRMSRVKQSIEAWENTSFQTLDFTNYEVMPSLGLNFSLRNIMVQGSLTTQTTYGLKKGNSAAGNIGLGFKF